MFPTKPSPLVFPPNLTDNAVYADEWIHHLVTRFGNAANGGVKFYAVDNEPDLWAETHTDVHPALIGYDEMLQKFLDYAGAIRSQDTTAKILGPVLSTPANFYNSPLDNETDQADRQAHGNQPFIDWWLSQVQASDIRKGIRTLDVLDVHYYPAGDLFFSDKNNDPALRPQRLEATRALWDSSFKTPGYDQPLNLIPKMRDMVERDYPGTLLGISEWNFGGEKDISGALATADTLGIFGEQGLYLANYWHYPPENSPTYFGFKMFGNYDGEGSRFGDVGLPTQSFNRNQVAIYAARQSQSSNGELTLVVINKTSQSQNVSVQLKNLNPALKNVKVWQYAAQDLSGIKTLADLNLTTAGNNNNNNNFDYNLAAYSITLFKVIS
jgi:hypothetical protein